MCVGRGKKRGKKDSVICYRVFLMNGLARDRERPREGEWERLIWMTFRKICLPARHATPCRSLENHFLTYWKSLAEIDEFSLHTLALNCPSIELVFRVVKVPKRISFMETLGRIMSWMGAVGGRVSVYYLCLIFPSEIKITTIKNGWGVNVLNINYWASCCIRVTLFCLFA